MNLFLLKLTLTPTLIALASVASRRWGAAVGGWLVGLPLTSAPITLFLAMEFGVAFASRAAHGILFGLICVAAFGFTYSRLAFRWSWLPSMLGGWAAFFGVTIVLQRVALSLVPTFIAVFIVLAIVIKLMPAREDAGVKMAPPAWDIPARMILATCFVLLLTGLARTLGAQLSGLLAPFPVFATILAVFTHRFHGPNSAARLLRGVVLGSFAFATFFLVIGLTIESFGLAAAFGLATVAALLLHGIALMLASGTAMRSNEQFAGSGQLPTLTLDRDQRAKLWKKTIQSIDHYVNEVENYTVVADVNAKDIRTLINSVDFNKPVDPLEAIDFTTKALRRYQTHTAHPRYFGLFDPAPATMSIAAEMLVAAVNPQLSVWNHSPFAVEVEQHLLRAFGEKFGYVEGEIDGTFTSGGAEANHTAVISALTHTFPEFESKGLRAISGSPVLYMSSEAHHSFVKAARSCGLGTDAVRTIPVDDKLRMDVDLLTVRIARDKAEGFVPFMVVATAGTTNAGAVDSIYDIASIAEREKLWLHTDAAWGGAAALVPELRSMLTGIEWSDSITFDPHKLLSITRGAGMYFTRHPSVLKKAFGAVTPYMPLQHTSGLDVVNPFAHSIQWSRRFTGLKLFLTLLVTGWDGYAEVVRNHLRLAHYLAAELDKNGWSVVNDPLLAVVCFFDRTTAKGGSETYVEFIANEIKTSGRAWLSTTRINQDRPVLRACVSNHRTTMKDVDALVSQLNSARVRYATRETRRKSLNQVQGIRGRRSHVSKSY